MSHITSVAVKIRDLNALDAAVRELGGVLVRNKKTHTFYGGQGTCDHCIQLPGVRYEIGVVKEADNTYKLNLDSYGYEGNKTHDGHKLIDKFGVGLKKIAQYYGIAKATMEAKAKGWLVQRNTLANGTVRLTMTGVGA